MQVTKIKDRTRLADYMQKKPALNAYPLGDLDDPYWQDTQFFAIEEGGEILEIALLYSGIKTPILIAVENNSPAYLTQLLREIKHLFPDHVYAHLSPSPQKEMLETYSASSHGPHQIMVLKNMSVLTSLDTSRVIRVNNRDYADLLNLIELAYPSHWLERKMLDYGPYFGIKDAQGQFLCVGGVHVYSETYKVATIGNVATHPKARGKGFGSQLIARLCHELSKSIKTIGLNVHSENQEAIHIYEKLSFEKIMDYEEFTLVKR